MAEEREERDGAPRAPRGRVPKQAVVIVHGMGEQRPMDTIKGFVEAVWRRDPRVQAGRPPDPAEVWSKPDQRTGSLELRRITTRESAPSARYADGARTDFYELYWADLSGGTRWDQFVNWVRYLLFRPLDRVPADVHSAWLALWAASAALVLLAGLALLPEAEWKGLGLSWMPRWLFVAAVGACGARLHRTATSTFGRVVRYTRADPDNIAARAAIRKRGIELLEALHEGDEYVRIVIVGHSLGSMLAYDLIGYFWASRAAARRIAEGSPEFSALCGLERATADLGLAPGDAALAAFAAARDDLRALMARRPAPARTEPPSSDARWLISDFVTLGSPLAHAEFLIASSRGDLLARQAARELATAPPMRELLDPAVLARAQGTGALPIAAPPEATRLMAFPDPAGGRAWSLHHAAAFSVVRWTNVFDPADMIVRGDLISGPLRPRFGAAVADVDLRRLRGQARSFSHASYWSLDADPRVLDALRKAVNILDEA